MASAKAVVRMFECEVMRSFVRGEQRTREWKTQKVRLIDDGAEVRCMYCHGEVHIVRQKRGKGQPDHVQHVTTDSASSCKGGDGGDARQAAATRAA